MAGISSAGRENDEIIEGINWVFKDQQTIFAPVFRESI